MRVSGVLLVVLLGCTKPNPNRCCSDEAECIAKDIPVGSVCHDGLVCRGNQCIAQPCSSSNECDGAAPYCVAELCAESCTEDAQCPGATQDASKIYCVEGGCATCRASTDCDPDAPVCDRGACRTCAAHDECASQICDRGTCVSETQIAYASPGGSTSAGCTQQQPCTLQRALAISDATRNVIKLLPGSYPPSTDTSGYWWFRGAFELTIYGPATLESALLNVMPANGVQAIRLRDLSTTSWVQCSGAGGNTIPTLELDGVNIDYSTDTGSNYALSVDRCTATVRDSAIRASGPFFNGVLASAGGATTGYRLVVERSLIQTREGVNNAGRPIILTDGCSLEMINSIVRGGHVNDGAISFGANVGPSTVTFSTFYNGFLKCPSGMLILNSQNNIFLNELSNAPATTLTGAACNHRYVIAKPQSAPIEGANNISNMDPRFVDGANGDFHLIAGSPAIDKADPAETEPVDFDGTTRPQGAGRDIGAFEYK